MLQHKQCRSPSSVFGAGGAGASSTAAGGAGSDFFALALGCLDSLEASDSEDICKGSTFAYKRQNILNFLYDKR